MLDVSPSIDRTRSTVSAPSLGGPGSPTEPGSLLELAKEHWLILLVAVVVIIWLVADKK